jgi:hypothetical protein
MGDKGNYEKNEEHEEQQLRYSGSGYRDTGKTKNPRDHRDDQKY